MIEYRTSAEGLRAEQLVGFFEGWPDPPSPATHLRLLRGSAHVALALEGERAVVGFVTAISDGVLACSIPLLEVLPSHRGRGIGSELVRRLLERVEPLYMTDLTCDPGLQGFYERLGFRAATAMVRRDYGAQSGSG